MRDPVIRTSEQPHHADGNGGDDAAGDDDPQKDGGQGLPEPDVQYGGHQGPSPGTSCTILGPSRGVARSQSKTRRVSRIRKGMGSILPITAAVQAVQGSRPWATPMGMAPRSSSTGIMAHPAVSSSFLSIVSKKPMRSSKTKVTVSGSPGDRDGAVKYSLLQVEVPFQEISC